MYFLLSLFNSLFASTKSARWFSAPWTPSLFNLISLYFSRRVLQGIAAGIGTSNFLRAFFFFFIILPRNFLTLSSFGLSKATFAFLCVSTHRTYLAKPLAKKCLVWRSFAFLSVSSRTRYIHPVVFHPTWWTLWNLSAYLTTLDLHQRSYSHRCSVASITSLDVSEVLVTSMYFSWIGNDSSLGTNSLTLGSTWWRWTNCLKMDQK